MRAFRTLSLTFLFAALTAGPSLAQESSDADAGLTLSADALAATLADHESAADRQRARLADLLSREDVRAVAGDRGIDLGQVESAAAGLTDAQMTAVTPLMGAIDAVPQDNGGGLGTITVGVGALIAGLLILILVT